MYSTNIKRKERKKEIGNEIKIIKSSFASNSFVISWESFDHSSERPGRNFQITILKIILSNQRYLLFDKQCISIDDTFFIWPIKAIIWKNDKLK